MGNDPILYKLTHSQKWPDWQPIKRKDFYSVQLMDISDKAKLLWAILKNNARDWPGSPDNGETRLSQAIMAKYLNCNQPYVSKIVKELEDKKLLKIKKKGIYQMNNVEANFVYTPKQVEHYSPQEYSEGTTLGTTRNIGEANLVKHIRRGIILTNNLDTTETIKPLVGTRSENEYKTIWKQMGKPDNFDISDMKFIDESFEKKVKKQKKGDIFDELGI